MNRFAVLISKRRCSAKSHRLPPTSRGIPIFTTVRYHDATSWPSVAHRRTSYPNRAPRSQAWRPWLRCEKDKSESFFQLSRGLLVLILHRIMMQPSYTQCEKTNRRNDHGPEGWSRRCEDMTGICRPTSCDRTVGQKRFCNICWLLDLLASGRARTSSALGQSPHSRLEATESFGRCYGSRISRNEGLNCYVTLYAVPSAT